MPRQPRWASLFDLSGRSAVVTGGTGVLGSAIARGLARNGARVAVLARHTDAAEELADEIRSEGGEAMALTSDVLVRNALHEARGAVLREWGHLDVLVNAAGGNTPDATVATDGSVFDLDPEAVRRVVELNLMGTLLPVQVFAEVMAEAGKGSIVNISSMAASQPLSRVGGYSAAKAAVENLTRWLADHLARRFGPGIRVNSIAPGFFVAEQNRSLLVEPDGSLTPRGESVIAHTPMGRFGEPDEVTGAAVWLASDASAFVTGAVIPVDGGFSASSGV